MRRWFAVLLIMLLPWRAWAGDAMMLSMVTLPAQAAQTAQAPASTAVPHCAEHGAGDAASPVEVTQHAACDICNGPLLAAAPRAASAPDALPTASLASGPVRFVSAMLRLGHKPPIA